MALDLATMKAAERELLIAGAKQLLAKAKEGGGQDEPKIPADVQKFLDDNGMTMELKKPAVMSAVDPTLTTLDPKDLELTGVGPQAKLTAPAIIHDSTKRDRKDLSLAHMVGILALGRDYPFLADAGLELEELKAQKSRGRGPMSEEKALQLAERQQQLKDLNLSSEVAGSFFIPTEIHSDMIMKLRGQEIFMNMGVDYFPDSPKFQEWDKEGRDPLIYWPGDTPTTNISTSDIDYGNATLTLHAMACVVPIYLNLIKHARRNVEEDVRRKIVTAMAIEQTKVGLRGTGSKQPLGLFNHPSMAPYTTGSIGVPDFDNLLDAINSIRRRDGIVAATQSAWVMHTDYLSHFQKSKTGTAEYSYIMDLTNMPADRILGLPVYTSSQIRTDLGAGAASRAMLVGDVKAIMLADGGETEITILKELYALTFRIGVLASREIDFGIRREEDIQFLTGLTLT